MAAQASSSISRGMRPQMAQARINAFRKRFSNEAYYYFAQHAAFPLALTPDLLYQLRAHFQHDIAGNKFALPWIAIADLLLSPICEETDSSYELYEIDITIRAQLLQALQDNPKFGDQRIKELASFLLTYIQAQIKNPDPATLDLIQGQTWTALAYLNPDQIARQLAEQIIILNKNGSLDQIRITSIMEALQTLNPKLAALKGFQPLLTYAQLQSHTFLGHTQPADTPDLITSTTQEVAAILNITLPIERSEASSVRQAAPSTISDFYISHHIADHDWARWIARHLQAAGYTVRWGFEFGPASSLDIDTSSLRNQARFTLALLSPSYLSVDNIQNEWNAILTENQGQTRNLLLPIRVRECTPQGIFASIQYVDFVGRDRETASPTLLRFIQQFLNAIDAKPPISDDDERRIQELESRAQINQDAATYVELGKLYERLRRIDDTIRAYEQARSLQPSDVNALYTLSRLYNDTGRYEQAIEDLNQLIELQPEFADAYKQRGLVYRRQADAEYATTENTEQRSVKYKQAVADLERAIKLRPNFEEALGSLGGIYRRQGDYAQAVEYYQSLYSVNPGSSYALGNLASLSWYLGRRQEANEYFLALEAASRKRIKEWEEIPPGQHKEGQEEAYWDYYDLALSQLAIGEIEVAKETYKQAIEKTPAIAQFDAVLSNLYFLQQASEPLQGMEEIMAMISKAKNAMETEKS